MEQITREEMSELLGDYLLIMNEQRAPAEEIARVEQAIAALQAAEPVAHRYRFADPISGHPVWLFSPGIWNGQRPKESYPLFALPCPPAKAQVPEGHCLDVGHRRVKAATGADCSCPKYVRHPECTRHEYRQYLPEQNPWLTASPAPEHSGDNLEMVEILKWIASRETAKGCYDGSDEVGAIKERVTSFLARHHQQEEAER